MLPPAERFALAAGPDLEVAEPVAALAVDGQTHAASQRADLVAPGCSGGWISAGRSDWRCSVIGCRSCWPASRSRRSLRTTWCRSTTTTSWSPRTCSGVNRKPHRWCCAKAGERLGGDQRDRGDPDGRQQRICFVRGDHVPGRTGLAGKRSRGFHRCRVGADCVSWHYRAHARIRYYRAKEHGAFATPHGRPRKPRQDAPHGSAVKTKPLRGRPEGRALTPAP